MGKRDKQKTERKLQRAQTPLPVERAEPGGAWPVLHRVIDVVSEYLKHHALLGALLIAAVVVVASIALLTGRCIEIETEYTGKITSCTETEAAEQTAPPDGLHGNVYSDHAAGYSLRIGEPENWSIFPAIDIPDEATGTVAKGFSIPAGVLARIAVGFLTDEAATVFVSRREADSVVVTVWVYHLARTGRVEELIAEELEAQRMRKTGASIVAHITALVSSDNPPTLGMGNPDAKDRLTLSTQQVGADHKSALLLWKSPYAMFPDIDIIGRFVVGADHTLYVVAIRPKPAGALGEEINHDVRGMIESLAVF